MKNKLSRILVMLLAIAMMIPSFALAEATFTITPKADAPKQYYIAGDSNYISEGVLGTFTVAGVPDNFQTAYVKWSSNKETVATVASKTTLYKDLMTNQNLPSVTKKGVGEATITGELFVNNATTNKTATFTVKVEEKPLEKFAFKDTAKKQFDLTNDADKSYNLFNQLDVLGKEGEGASYSIMNVQWEITAGNDVATLSINPEDHIAQVTFSKPGSVTVQASIPGTQYKATWTANIIGPDESETQHETIGYDTVAFTAEKVYITDSSINLLAHGGTYLKEVTAGDDYDVSWYDWFAEKYMYFKYFRGSLLNLLPVNITNDPLTWTGTTPTAQVSVSNKGVVNFGDQYGEVVVTVKSTVNKKEDKITVVRLDKEDKVVPYETLTFDPTELTVRRDDTVNVNDFLTTVPVQNKVKNDKLVYESSDTSIAFVDVNGNVTPKVDEGTVTIKVFAKANPDKVKAELKLTFQKAAKSKYQALTFSKTTFDFKVNENDRNISFNATDYLTTVPVEKPVNDSLTWTSSDSDVASVSASGLVTLQPMSGTATIKVENKDKSVFAAITVNVEVVKNPYKAITVSAEAQKGLTIEEGETIDLKDYLTLELTRAGVETTDKLVFVVDNAKTATVTTAGMLKGVKASDKPVTVTVRNTTGSAKAEIKVTVEKPKTVTYTSLKFDTAALEVPKNFPAIDVKERHLIAVEPNDFNDESGLVWKSSDETVAYFANPAVGTLTIAKPGTTEISVRNGENTVKSENVLKLTVLDAEAFTEVTAVDSSMSIKAASDEDTKYSLAYNVLTKGGYGDSLVWTSNNQQIALVDNNGNVTVKAGTADGATVIITARSKLDDSKAATINVTIKKNLVLIKSIKLTQDTFELEPKGTIYLGRYVVTDPVETPDDELIFTSDDPSVVMHDNDAEWDARLYEDGEAHITVRSKNNPDCEAKQFTIKLKAKGVESIEFKDAPKTFYKKISYYDGDDVILESLNLWDYLVVKPVDFDMANLTWESSDPTVASVVYGYVNYMKAGTATITVTDRISGKSAKVKLTLAEKHPVESIALKNIKMKVGEDYDLTRGFITYTPANADFDPSMIKWTSSNRDVAEVQADEDDDRWTTGSTIKAYKAGKTTISAKYEREDGTIVKAKCTVTVKDVKLEDVKFAASKYTLKLNSKLDAIVRFNIEPFNCSYDESDIYFVSSRNDIVSVDDYVVDKKDAHKGAVRITAKAPGSAWVIVKLASNDKVLDACKVVVKAVKIKTVKWEKKSVKLYWYNDGITEFYDGTKSNTVYKNFITVKPIINPENAYCNVSFETTDPGVAFVDNESVKGFQNAISSGSSLSGVKILAVGPGTCKIVMKVDDGKKVRKATLNVEVETKRVKLTMSQRKATLKMEKGSNILYLRAYDANTDKDVEVKWASSDTKVAKVNVDGKVRAVGEGTATISATTKNGQKQVVKCKIIVKAPSTKNVAAKKITGDTKVTVKAGEKKALEIKVKPEGAKVTFTSSDTKIVKVTKDGTIKGIKAGKATITVKAAEGKAELKIKVVVK